LERTKRIAERLPEFYRSWDPDSTIFKIVDAVGRALAETQKDLFRVIKTHWVDTAFGTDLDRLGAIFELGRGHDEGDEEYRERIKNALRQFKGGGTRGSILSLMADFLETSQDALELDENPEGPMSVKKKLAGGESWTIGSMSVEDAFPTIEITLEGEGDVVLNPAIRDLDSEERVGLQGNLRVGQRLVMSKDSATLDGRDVSASISSTAFPRLKRGGSRLVYEEEISANVGRFDKSHFDSSIFRVPVPDAIIRLTWNGRQPSTFQFKVASNALKDKGVTEEDAADFLNIIKGAGVKATLVVRE
jgi:hypothetical protein